MQKRASNRRCGGLRAFLACVGLALAAPAWAQSTATQLGLSGSATRTYGTRNVVTGFVTSPDVTCPLPAAAYPTGAVRISFDGTPKYSSPVQSFACIGGQARGVFDVTRELIPIGTHAITAEYSGDGRFAGSISAPLTVTITAQFSGSLTPDSGKVEVGLTSDVGSSERWDCRVSTASIGPVTDVPTAPPADLEMPYGLFHYALDSCVYSSDFAPPPPPPGLRQRLLMRAPALLPTGSALWTYGPRNPGELPVWYRMTARVDGAFIEAFLDDGGMGDETLAGDGLIRGAVAIAIPRTTHLKFDVVGLWWAGAQENGWGMSIARSRDVLFNTFFVYDGEGRPQWIVMPGGAWNADYTTYTGPIYIPSGTWFGAYDASRLVVGPPVGNASLTFSASNAATLTYSVRGAAGTKVLQKQRFSPDSPAVTPDYTALWWGGEPQNGWGLSIHQQGQTLFNVWYTYDAAGNGIWYVMPGGAWISPNVYSGALYRTRGSAWAGRSYDPARLAVERAGTMTIAFDNANSAYVTYVLDGVEQTRSITRQPF